MQDLRVGGSECQFASCVLSSVCSRVRRLRHDAHVERRPRREPGSVCRPAVAQHRPVSRRAHRVGHRRDRPARRVLRRHAGRRHLENDQRRRDVVPDLRSVHERRQHRRDSGRAVRSQHRLCRHRRLRAGIVGRRHVQVHRRRQDVDAHRPRGDDQDQQDRRRSEGSESRRRVDAGRRAAQRPGHLSHDRRRQDVGEHAASGERERHARCRVRVRHAEPDVRDEPGHAGGGFGGGGGGGAAAAAPAGGPAPPNGTALYKSTDAGKTWKKVDTLPPYTGRISVAVAMHTNGQRLYVVGGALQGGSGLYRSDDQGATWQHMAGNDTRIGNGQGAYSSGVWVDSQNPDILYTVAPPSIDRTTAARRSPASRARPAARTRTTSGSIRRTASACCSAWIRARPSRSTAARRGAATTRSRSRRSTTSRRTRGIRTGCWRRSRTPARS